MNLFEQIKELVTARVVAETYGIKVKGNGMACCPFHNDRHPSMKVDKNYHCFVCNIGGDAIDFTARLFGLTQYEAAKKLITDFQLPIELHEKSQKKANRKVVKPQITKEQKDRLKKMQLEKKFVAWVEKSTDILITYRKYLVLWREKYQPQIEQENWHTLFKESLNNLQKIEDYLDVLLSNDMEEKVLFFHAKRKEVRAIENRISEYERRYVAESGGESERRRTYCG